MTKSKINQLSTYFDNNPKATIRKRAKKLELVKQSGHQNAVTRPKSRCLYKSFFKRILFWMTILFFLCQTPQLLGMMGITPVTPKMLLQTSSIQ